MSSSSFSLSPSSTASSTPTPTAGSGGGAPPTATLLFSFLVIFAALLAAFLFLAFFWKIQHRRQGAFGPETDEIGGDRGVPKLWEVWIRDEPSGENQSNWESTCVSLCADPPLPFTANPCSVVVVPPLSDHVTNLRSMIKKTSRCPSMSTVCRPKKRYLPHHTRGALGPVASSVAGQCRSLLPPMRSRRRPTVQMQKGPRQRGLSAVVSGCHSLSRCPMQTRRRSGADLKSPGRRRWWSSRIGGAGSMPLGYIILLSGKGGRFEPLAFVASVASSSLPFRTP